MAARWMKATLLLRLLKRVLQSDEMMTEPAEVKSANKIPETLQTHKVVRERSKQGVFCLKSFYLSSDTDQFHTQWYSETCGHQTQDVDENRCSCCLKVYEINQDWMKCPINDVNFIQKWGSAFGTRSLHATFNKLKVSYRSMHPATRRMQAMLNEHYMNVNPKSYAF